MDTSSPEWRVFCHHYKPVLDAGGKGPYLVYVTEENRIPYRKLAALGLVKPLGAGEGGWLSCPHGVATAMRNQELIEKTLAEQGED